jgi:hypothetical protein
VTRFVVDCETLLRIAACEIKVGSDRGAGRLTVQGQETVHLRDCYGFSYDYQVVSGPAFPHHAEEVASDVGLEDARRFA